MEQQKIVLMRVSLTPCAEGDQNSKRLPWCHRVAGGGDGSVSPAVASDSVGICSPTLLSSPWSLEYMSC